MCRMYFKCIFLVGEVPRYLCDSRGVYLGFTLVITIIGHHVNLTGM